MKKILITESQAKTIINELFSEKLQQNPMSESFQFGSLPAEQQKHIFDVFKSSYEKATGASWDEQKFKNRATEWLFFGDNEGFVTVRPQRSGFYKLTGVAGNIKSIMKGLKELDQLNAAVWGMSTKELSDILIKRYKYRSPNKIEAFLISKLIPSNVFGNVKYHRNPDGGITFEYPDVGTTTKYFVANDNYYKKLRVNLTKRIIPKFLKETQLNELRSGKYKGPKAMDVLKDFVNTYGKDNTYISFRHTVNVADINKNNTFNTPTGFYLYPLKSFELEELENPNFTWQDFLKNFPYGSSNKFVFLFTIRNVENILFTSKPNKQKCDEYARKIKQTFENNPDVINLCNQYLQGTLSSKYTKVESGQINISNPVHGLWVLIHQIAVVLTQNDPTANELKELINLANVGSTETTKTPISMKDRRFVTLVNTISRKIGIDGFIDDACDEMIHEAEPCQGIVFKFKSLITDLKIIDSHLERIDIPMNFDKNIYYLDSKHKFEKRMEKKIGRHIFVIDHNDTFKQNIINNLPVLAKIDSFPVYLTRDGEITLPNKKPIYDSNISYTRSHHERAAYLNGLYKKLEFQNVYPLGDYHPNHALALMNDSKYYIINEKGNLDLEGIFPNVPAPDRTQLYNAYFATLIKLGLKQPDDESI